MSIATPRFYDYCSNHYFSGKKHATEETSLLVNATLIQTTDGLSASSVSAESGIGLSASNDSEDGNLKKNVSKGENAIFFRAMQSEQSSSFFYKGAHKQELAEHPGSNGNIFNQHEV